MTPTADGAVLRHARPEDVPGILALIHELAVYEREPDAVETTQDMLRETLFGEAPAAYCHVVALDEEQDGSAPRVLAIALWFLTYSTWTGRHGIWLEDLIVTESSRGTGYGMALMRELAASCVERGYGRFEWTVLKWNEPSIGFYRSIGAVPMDDWSVQRLSGEALTALGRR